MDITQDIISDSRKTSTRWTANEGVFGGVERFLDHTEFIIRFNSDVIENDTEIKVKEGTDMFDEAIFLTVKTKKNTSLRFLSGGSLNKKSFLAPTYLLWGNYIVTSLPNEASELLFAINLKEQESIDEIKAIDVLYEHIFPIMFESDYKKIDSLISAMMLLEFNLTVIVALLTITNPIKEKLNLRINLINYSNSIASKQGLSAEQIKSILKGF